MFQLLFNINTFARAISHSGINKYYSISFCRNRENYVQEKSFSNKINSFSKSGKRRFSKSLKTGFSFSITR